MRKRKCRRAFAVSVLACLISALCAAPALADDKTYDDVAAQAEKSVPGTYLQDPPSLPLFLGNNNTFAPDNYLAANSGNNTITVDYTPDTDKTNPGRVFGGYSGVVGATVTGNAVALKNGVVSSSVYGGFGGADNITVTGNTVNILGGTASYAYGGYILSYNSLVTGNFLNINAGNVYFAYGGYASAVGTVVTGNFLNINAGSVGEVYGGYSYYGNATNNTVNISGGKVSNSVTGGYSYSGNAATDNTVAISGTADISSTQGLYGGNGSAGDKRTGNTLHINNWKGNTRATIANFENYQFTLPANAANGDTVLNVTTGSGGVDLGPKAKIRIAFAGDPTAQGLQKVNLIRTEEANQNIAGSLDNNDVASDKTTAQTTYGATIYTFDIALEDPSNPSGTDYKLLTAAWAGPAQNQVDQDKAKSYLYGASARLTSLVNGADHMVSILDNWKCAPETPTTTGFRSFVSMQGSTIKTRIGSSINNNGASFALGGVFDTATRLGTLTTGLFAEGGIGSYNSYSRFGWGDGDTWHYGIGAFAKHAFTNRIYLEGFARIGRAKTDFDGKGSIADLHYNSEGNYWGAHAGVGIDYPLNTVSSVDTYAKLLWTHQDSDTVTTRAKERLSFDSADSLRSRIGTRYRHRVEENLRAHVGVGWEYEFDGRERAKLDGTKIAHEPETQGHSALVEAGIEWRATKSWSVNANATAMGGQRKGLSGYAQATYRF